MEQYHIVYRTQETAVLKGQNYSADSIESALKQFRKQFPTAEYLGSTNNTKR